MPESRRSKIDRLVRAEDKKSSLAAGVLLYKGLFDSGIDPAQDIGYAPDTGKPYVGIPGVCFSLSHSGSRAMCAISDRDCGCDVESIDSADLAIADMYFSEEEKRSIQSAVDRDEMFIRLWTLKESFSKAVGLGLSLPLDSFSISFDNDVISIRQSADDCHYHFKEFHIGDGYCYSCCSTGCDIPDSMEFMDLSSVFTHLFRVDA